MRMVLLFSARQDAPTDMHLDLIRQLLDLEVTQLELAHWHAGPELARIKHELSPIFFLYRPSQIEPASNDVSGHCILSSFAPGDPGVMGQGQSH